MLAESIRDIIVNTPAAVSGLATWEFSSGVLEPAVFTNMRTPPTGKRISVEVMESGGIHWGVRGYPGKDAVVSVRVMGNKNVSQTPLRTAADAIYDALHRQTTGLDLYTRPRGYEGIAVLAEPLSSIIDEDGFPGYLIALRVLVMKL